MFERERVIAGLRKECNTLRELIEELEYKPRIDEVEFQYCSEVLKKVEATLRKLRQPISRPARYIL